jgi:hypothetical protein
MVERINVSFNVKRTNLGCTHREMYMYDVKGRCNSPVPPRPLQFSTGTHHHQIRPAIDFEAVLD